MIGPDAREVNAVKLRQRVIAATYAKFGRPTGSLWARAVCGIDHFELLLRQPKEAQRRRDPVRSGYPRVGSVDAPPAFEMPFDEVLTVKAGLFWDEPDAAPWGVRRLLQVGGGDRRCPPSAGRRDRERAHAFQPPAGRPHDRRR
jgi:hypothetical protein